VNLPETATIITLELSSGTILLTCQDYSPGDDEELLAAAFLLENFRRNRSTWNKAGRIEGVHDALLCPL